MTAKECITGRRSIRKFTADPVSHEVLADIVSTAAYAPSWKNTQITRYIALEGASKDAVAERTIPHNAGIINGAPMLIAVTMITGRCGYERDGSFSTSRKDGWQMFDVGVASEAFCLAAHEQGLGTVIMGLFNPEDVSDVLNLPEGRELVALIAIGHPDEAPAAPARKTVEDLLSYQ